MSTNDTICASCAKTRNQINGRYCTLRNCYVEYSTLLECDGYTERKKR